MPRTRRLRGDMPRLLASHRGRQATQYRRMWDALVRDLGPFPRGSLQEHQAARVAALWVEFSEATRVLAEARQRREAGRGRRPSAGLLDRLSHRMLTASAAYQEALGALRAMAPARTPTLEEVMARAEAARARTGASA